MEHPLCQCFSLRVSLVSYCKDCSLNVNVIKKYRGITKTRNRIHVWCVHVFHALWRYLTNQGESLHTFGMLSGWEDAHTRPFKSTHGACSKPNDMTMQSSWCSHSWWFGFIRRYQLSNQTDCNLACMKSQNVFFSAIVSWNIIQYNTLLPKVV